MIEGSGGGEDWPENTSACRQCLAGKPLRPGHRAMVAELEAGAEIRATKKPGEPGFLNVFRQLKLSKTGNWCPEEAFRPLHNQEKRSKFNEPRI